MSEESDLTNDLLERAAAEDTQALEELFAMHRVRLLRMVHVRLDRRLHGRIDASDVMQETYLEAWQRLAGYLRDENRMPFFLWLRFLAGQKVLELHRRHLGAQRRDARQEVRLRHGSLPGVTSDSFAWELTCGRTGPNTAAARAELRAQLEKALEAMEPADREILSLRHFEQLTHAEAACELGLSEAAARQRYFRALRRFKDVLGGLPAGSWEI